MADLFTEAVEAREKGDFSQARQLLAQSLVQDPHSESAWMMMSELVEEARLKRSCLQRVLLINPKNEAANTALMKLDTSPLGPVTRGERNKPVIPPKVDRTPPFTPPFTWSGDDAQFQALGDMIYPDQTGEQVNQPIGTSAKFDWAIESSEPDETIEKIFDKVSNPEQANEPHPDTSLDWLEAQAATGSNGQGLSEEEKEDRLLDALVVSSAAGADNEAPPVAEDSATSTGALPATGVVTPATEPDYQLWDNPKAKTNRMVILGSSSIIYANPVESDVVHIKGLFNEKKMLRDLLGENAGTIKLESIERIEAIPAKADLKLRYRQNDKSAKLKLVFSTPEVRDEALSAIECRLDKSYSRHSQKFSLGKKIFAPLLCMLLVAAISWLFITGMQYLDQLVFFQSGWPEIILYNVEYYVELVGTQTILIAGAALASLCLVWLLARLAKPAEVVIVDCKTVSE